MPVTGVMAFIAATPVCPIKNHAIMLSLSSMKYMTALVKVPDMNMELNFLSQNPFIFLPQIIIVMYMLVIISPMVGAAAAKSKNYSHSIVAGGLPVMS